MFFAWLSQRNVIQLDQFSQGCLIVHCFYYVAIYSCFSSVSNNSRKDLQNKLDFAPVFTPFLVPWMESSSVWLGNIFWGLIASAVHSSEQYLLFNAAIENQSKLCSECWAHGCWVRIASANSVLPRLGDLNSIIFYVMILCAVFVDDTTL